MLNARRRFYLADTVKIVALDISKLAANERSHLVTSDLALAFQVISLKIIIIAKNSCGPTNKTIEIHE